MINTQDPWLMDMLGALPGEHLDAGEHAQGMAGSAGPYVCEGRIVASGMNRQG